MESKPRLGLKSLFSIAFLGSVLLAVEPDLKRSAVSFLYMKDPLKPADIILVLSGGNESERTDHAVALYKGGYAAWVLFSGSVRMSGGDNAEYLKNLAVKKGLPESAVLIEDQATSTYENILFSRKILLKMNAQRVLLVTSPLHQRRAYLVARKVLRNTPIEIVNAPFDSPETFRSEGFLWSSILKEYVKLAYYFLTEKCSRRGQAKSFRQLY